jgi:protein MpaA
VTIAARLRMGATALALAVAALAPGLGAEAQTGQEPARILAGKSVQGRAIRALRLGDPDADRVGLVVGVIHGDERAGLRVTRALKRRWRELRGAQVWVVDAVNPDGLEAGTRKNARGVDLNRNFPYRWSSAEPPSSGYYGGPRPFSEPESRAVRALVTRIEPDVSIWYHQPWGAVLACKGRPRVAARYAKLTGMATSCRGKGLPGTAISWQKHRFPGTNAFVVEFGHRKIRRRAARRNAWAAVKVIRGGAGG